MKKMLPAKATGVLAGLALCLGVLPPVTAQPSVDRVDEDTLRIVDYSGKPPFKRRHLTLNERNEAEFARYEAMLEPDSRPVSASSERAGPPGKSLPPQRRRVSGSEDPAAAARHGMWRGAPGKSRPRVNN